MVVLGGRVTPTASTSNSSQSSKRESTLVSNSSTTITNNTNVKVVLRIRPSSASDPSIPTRFQRTVIHPTTPTTLQIEGGGNPSSSISSSSGGGGSLSNKSNSSSNKVTFTFDRVIGPEEGQSSVYECAESLVESFMMGMNSTILAYGQTASGKSYTMGTDRTFMDDQQDDEDNYHNSSGREGSQDRLGITPRAVNAIFDRMKEVQSEARGKITFTTKLSYIEIYNEDLIDLLAEDLEVKPVVQIREDKAGNIIWSGLKEIKVTSASEVMKNLTAGSALRQTNATDMNAQSSRSHAIFSLTLTQRRYTGAGSPLPPPSPSSARAGGPGGPRQSLLPTNRANTPTGLGPNGRPGSILRPSSSSGGPRSSSSTPVPFEDGGLGVGGGGGRDTEAWVSVSSKFHFVDLAGSERLKRTAAQGERVKEGISINSGLHALGNVISALGDPARARQTTHIPYRDSKLTRLLQDSLGGNSQTMMIACVSPSEFNLNETISTVKYANRARNIKNRAEINEIEVGWDDVEYLQRTITRLRVELIALKTGEGIPEESLNGVAGGSSRNGSTGDLNQRYASLTADLGKVRTSISSATSTNTNNTSTTTATTSTISRDDFAKAVEPIVEEYEKSLSALESQLSLTKAALSHSEDEMRDLENRIEEETRTNEISGALILELKSRVVRLTEREATTEAYVRDLEGKLKDYDDQDEKRGSAVSDLRKEITRSREQAEKTEQYIKDLELRHTKSDDITASLQRQIEVLERDIERREESNRDLESRLNLLDTSGDHKLLLAEIDERDQRVLELERSLDELNSKHIASELEATRLQKIAEEEKEAKSELAIQIRTLERAQTISPTSTTFQSIALPSLPDPVLISRIDELQATYEETLAELESANVKYKESLKEISDLNSQLEESKLINNAEEVEIEEEEEEDSNPTTPPPSTIPEDLETYLSPTLSNTSPNRAPRARRSMPLSPQHGLSFLSRGQSSQYPRSASLSQELSSAQGSQSSSPGSGPRLLSPTLLQRQSSRDINTSPGGTRSYEQINSEVLRLQEALNEREDEIMVLETRLHELHATNALSSSSTPSIGLLPAFKTPPKSILERSTITPSPRNSVDNFDLAASTSTTLGDSKSAEDRLKRNSSLSMSSGAGGLEGKNSVRLDGIMRSMAKKESVHKEAIDALTDNLTTLKRQHEELTTLSRDQVINMSSEIDALRTQLEDQPDAASVEWRLKIMQDELDAKEVEVETSRIQAKKDLEATSARLTEDHRQALETITSGHKDLLQSQESHAATLQSTLAERDETLRQREIEYTTALETQSKAHEEAIRIQSVSHEEVIQTKSREIESLVQKTKEEQEELIRRHQFAESDKIVQHSSELEQLKLEHAQLLDTHQARHQATIDRLVTEHLETSSTKDSNHAAALSELEEQHQVKLREVSQLHVQELEELRASHGAAILDLQQQHISTLEDASNEHVERSRKLEVDHLEEVSRLRVEHEGQLSTQASEHSSNLASKVTALEALHQSALLDVSTSSNSIFETKTKELEDRHTSNVSQIQFDHDSTLQKQLSTNYDEVATLKEEHSTKTKELDSTLASLKDEHSATLSKLSASHVLELLTLAAAHQETLDSKIKELKVSHQSEIATLRHEHETSRQAQTFSRAAELEAKSSSLESEHVTALANLARSHTDDYEKQSRDLESTHSTAVDQLQSDHQALLEAQSSAHQATFDAQTSANAKKAAALLTLASTRDSEQQTRTREAHTTEIGNLQDVHATELASLEEAHSTGLADLQHQHETALRRSNANSTDLEKQLVDLKEEHLATLSQVTSSHEQVLSDLYATHEAIIQNNEKESKDSHAASTITLQDQHEANSRAQTLESNRILDEKLSTLSTSHAKALSDLTGSHQVALTDLASTHDSVLDSRVRELNDLHSSNLAYLQSKHDEALQAQSLSSTGTLDDRLSSLAADHSTALSTLTSDHQLALVNQSRELKDSHSQELAELSSTHQSVLEHQSQTLTEAHALELDNARKDHEVALQEQASTHSTILDSTISSLSKKYDADLEDGSELADSELRSQMQRVAEAHYTELANLRSSHATALALQTSTSEAEISKKIVDLSSQHQVALEESSAVLDQKMQELGASHSAALLVLSNQHSSEMNRLKESHELDLQNASGNHSKDLASRIAAVELAGAGSLALLNRQHSEAINSLRESHESSLASLQSQHEKALENVQPDLDAKLYSLNIAHNEELERSQMEVESVKGRLVEHEGLVNQHSELQRAHQELLVQHDTLKDSFNKSQVTLPPSDPAMASGLEEALAALSTLEKALVESQDEREKLLLQVSDLRTNSRQHGRTSSSGSGPTQSIMIRPRSASSSHKEDRPPTPTSMTTSARNVNGNGNGNGNSFDGTSLTPDTLERKEYFPAGLSLPLRLDTRMAAPPPSNPPPPTPPPTMAPPALPRTASSRTPSWHNPPGMSPRSVTNPEALILKVNEQEASITRLTKQLTHCETDLQSNIDLVNTLESALNDSERSLRKARAQMNDMAKDRDMFRLKNEELRQNIANAQNEVESVRHNSIQAQSRLQEERNGKERAKVELEKRLEEMNRQKKNKCMSFFFSFFFFFEEFQCFENNSLTFFVLSQSRAFSQGAQTYHIPTQLINQSINQSVAGFLSFSLKVKIVFYFSLLFAIFRRRLSVGIFNIVHVFFPVCHYSSIITSSLALGLLRDIRELQRICTYKSITSTVQFDQITWSVVRRRRRSNQEREFGLRKAEFMES